MSKKDVILITVLIVMILLLALIVYNIPTFGGSTLLPKQTVTPSLLAPGFSQMTPTP